MKTRTTETLEKSLAAPSHLGAESQAVFRELVATAPTGTLSSADAPALEIAATLLASFRKDPAHFHAQKLVALIRLLGTLGLRPDKRRPAIPPPDPEMQAFLRGPDFSCREPSPFRRKAS